MIPWASAGHEPLKNSLLNCHIDFKRNVFNLRAIIIILKKFTIMINQSGNEILLTFQGLICSRLI